MDEYQHGFSEQHEAALYNREGRRQKAEKVLVAIEDYLLTQHVDPGALSLLDVGASTGIMTEVYAERFARTVGVDIDDAAIRSARAMGVAGATFVLGDSMHLPFADGAFDVAICTHIYEHVPDAVLLMDEIYRVLAPGGACYFAAGNRLRLMEPHYRLPLLSVIPKLVADRYLRLVRRGDHYYETHLTHGQLRRLVARFEIIDYTSRIVEDPGRFRATDQVRPGGFTHALARLLVRRAYSFVPTYHWMLRKPSAAGRSRAA